MRVIFICTGNTCRSPMAEGYLKSALIPNLTVESRGLFADSSPVSKFSAEVMDELGIDISEHISTGITNECLSADLFIVMSESHRDVLLGFGIPTDKIIVLGGGIFDPYGSQKSVYRACRDKIISEIDALIFSGIFTPFSIKALDEGAIKDIELLERECFSEAWSYNAILESYKAGTLFFCVYEDTNMLGYVGISTVLDEGYITNVAVTKSARKRGVASLLMHRLNTLARERALSFISLEVRRSNSAAISLYEKFKYKCEGERKGFYRNPTEDALIMTRRF